MKPSGPGDFFSWSFKITVCFIVREHANDLFHIGRIVVVRAF